MTYTDINMFMEKLKQLISCNDNPLFNNPRIISERPQFQLLYNELGVALQALSIRQDLHDPEKINDLKQRFIYAVEEAEYIVDLFLSSVHFMNTTQDFPTSEDFNRSLNLYEVVKSVISVQMEIEYTFMIIDNMKTKSYRRTNKTLYQSAAAQRNTLESTKSIDEIFVGLDHDVELIINKLVEDQKKLDVISLVGIGGIGKTTLATKVFNDAYVKHHFHVLVWVTVSQTYEFHERDVLVQILESIGVKLDLEEASDSRLHELVHKHLMGQRYLIVIDDIWHTKTWDELKPYFPHNNIGSRILLTTRLTEVAKHANSYGLIHHLGYLNKEKSWELLCQRVFQGNECPEWSIKPGMQIVENCQGLPLAVVVIAGVLAKQAWSKKFWVEIAKRTGSYIVGDKSGYLETLALSYNHLPLHLRKCFLYLGGFPKDYKFHVRWLIWLWVAEGFIQEDGNRSLEEIAEGYLMDLIDKSLVIITDKTNSNGAAIACKLNNIFRELCLIKAKEEKFIIQTERQVLSSPDVVRPPYKPVHMFIDKDINILVFPYLSTQNVRSITWFGNFISLSDDIAKYFRSFVLLRVLDLQKCELKDFPKGVDLLVHLRYLAVWNPSQDFPSSICKLWSLQTLIYVTEQSSRVVLPSNISDLVNLRHLWSYHPYTRKSIKRVVFLPSIEKPMNLQTISGVVLGEGVDNFQKCFPCIKELTCIIYSQRHYEFKSLTYLEKLKLTVHDGPKGEPKNHITFPATLKSLTLVGCLLPWSDMSIIQSLPNLQVLKLKYMAFEGNRWDTYEQEFAQLKFLRLEMLNIKVWEAYSISFPYLRQLEIFHCLDLEEIPHEIGDIPTLELIKIKKCRDFVGESVRRIEEEQHDCGNYDLKIDIFEDK
ncbi:putative P-loop containing nucleoside triphosphate hydrolase, leucine-rich repeat domain superfamily [Helianthus anomalus]